MAVKLMPVAAPVPEVHDPTAEPTPRAPRKRRRAAVFDADGREVLISLMCLKCHNLRPLSMFGLRKMADGAIRNQPWCRVCRGAAPSKKSAAAAETPAPADASATPPAAQAAPAQAAAAPPVTAPAPTAPTEPQSS